MKTILEGDVVKPLVVSLLALSLSGIACRGGQAISSDWTPRVEPLASPAGRASAEPQLTSSNRSVVLSWLESEAAETTLKFSERTANGWTEPRAVQSNRSLLANWADVPSVFRLASGTLVAEWLQETDPAAEAYDLRMASSNDDGQTWSQPMSPHHDGTTSQHGFASMFEMASGSLGIVWLDGRSMKEREEMSLRAAAFDRERNQLFEDAVDTRVCDCCPTAAAVTSDGPIVAFRDRSDDETRDISVSRFINDSWTEPVAVHHDGWHLNGCPVNGPALSANGRDVAVAWFTAPNDDGRAFVAFSGDAGKTFGEAVRVDNSRSLGRVDVDLLSDGSAMVSWIELGDSGATFMVRRVERSGKRSQAATVATLGASRSSSYPRMARRGNELLFAWTSSDSVQVQTAIARLP